MVKNPIDSPSGEKNGAKAPLVSGSFRAAGWSTSRTQSELSRPVGADERDAPAGRGDRQARLLIARTAALSPSASDALTTSLGPTLPTAALRGHRSGTPRRGPAAPSTPAVTQLRRPDRGHRWLHAGARRRRGRVGERRGELGGGGEAVGGKLLERGEHRRLDAAAESSSAARVSGARLLGHHPRDDRLRGRARERRLAHQHLVEHAARARRCRSGRRSRARPSPARGSCSAACRATSRSRSSARRRPCCTASAMPKSATSAWPSCSRMFSGLMSRWIDAVPVGVVERVGHLASRSAPRRRPGAAARA